MDIDMNKEHWENGACPKVDCRKGHCKCGLERVFLSAVLGDDSKDSPVAPKNGEYCNAIVVYEANNHVYIYSKEGIPTLVEAVDDVEEIIEQLEGQLAQEILDRQAADNVLHGEIEDLKNSPDVVDIVATYAALQAYDTSKLGDNDIIRVLVDETHDGDSTYYRWDSQTETWTYIGGISVKAITIFYADKTETGNTRHIYKDEGLTEGATVQDLLDASESGQVVLRKVLGVSPSVFRYEDMYLLYVFHLSGVAGRDFVFSYRGLKTLTYSADASSSSTYDYIEHSLQEKLTAGSNVTISGYTISATDTTYSDFTGTDGVDAGTAGLVPAPATTDVDKFLKADGTWDTAGGGGPTVVQTVGTSTTDVMSQNATSSMVYADPGTNQKIQIGDGSNAGGLEATAIGYYSSAQNWGTAVGTNSSASGESVSAGRGAVASSVHSVAIGAGARVENANNSVALGASASVTRKGEVNVGTGIQSTWGYDNTPYRVIGGVHDGQDAHDATTVGQVNTRLGGLTLLPITQTDYDALATKDANTLYVITGA